MINRLVVFLIFLYVPYITVNAQSLSEKVQVRKYQECLALIEEDKSAALVMARKLYIEGGGVAAQHCEALALYEDDKYKEAASLFEAIADKLSRGEGAGAFALQNKSLLKVQLNYLAGMAWGTANENDKAYNAYSSSIIGLEEKSPVAYDLYIERGLIQVARDEMDSAIADFSEALELNHQGITAFFHRATTFRKMGQHIKARLDLNEALVLDPNDPVVLFESGVNYRMQGDDDKAIFEWQKIIGKYPNSYWQKLVEDNMELIGR